MPSMEIRQPSDFGVVVCAQQTGIKMEIMPREFFGEYGSPSYKMGCVVFPFLHVALARQTCQVDFNPYGQVCTWPSLNKSGLLFMFGVVK